MSEYARSLFNENNSNEYGEQLMPTLDLSVTDLGPNNIGALGPNGLDDAQIKRLLEALARPEYSLPASNRWICIDGRCSAEEDSQADTRHDADPQTAGGLPITETATGYMDAPATHQPKSVMIAQTTASAIGDGLIVTVHGDQGGKGNCKANAVLQEALAYAAENASILVPRLWVASRDMGLDKWISVEDIYQSIENGGIAAQNDQLWDCTPEEAVDIAVQHGAEYIELQGPHLEVVDREDWTPFAFSKSRFNRDLRNGTQPLQAFSASVGKYREEAFRRAKLHGLTERDAALQTMRAKLFNRTAKKMLMGQQAKTGIIQYS